MNRRIHAVHTADDTEPPALAQPCPCCGVRMIIVKTFERGGEPRAPPPAGSGSPHHDDDPQSTDTPMLPSVTASPPAAKAMLGPMREWRGARTMVIPTCASPRPNVTVKKKRKAETAAFMEVAEAPMDRMCS